MSTSLHHHSHRPSRIEQVLRPRNMLDLLFGTVAACLVIGILTFSALAKPYQQPQDIRRQADSGQLTPAPIPTVGSNCNQPCSTNDDCAVNLRCYRGNCRLATNPPSSSCQPAAPSSVPSLTPTSPTKGGLGGATITPSVFPTVSIPPASKPTSSATESAIASASPTLTMSPPVPEPTSTPGQKPVGWLSTLSDYVTNLLSPEQANTRRMLLAILAVGLILIGIAFVINALTKPAKSKVSKNKSSSGNASGSKSPTASQSSGRSTGESASESDSVPPSTLTTTLPKTVVVTAAPTQNSATGTSPTAPITAPINSAPANISSAPLYPSGGMTTRLKQKGVTPPS